MSEDLNTENPSEFIKKASEDRANKILEDQERIANEEMLRQKIIQQQAVQNIIDRKIRENSKKDKAKKKVKTIEDAIKKGDKIRWEIVGNNTLKGFVKNKFVFEIKRGLTIFNLYVKDKSFLAEKTKQGYISCASNLDSVKKKAENLLV